MSNAEPTCALTGMANSTKTWCGKDGAGLFCFTDASHAALNRGRDGLVLCRDCREAIVEALDSGAV
jgi:hypothetical protein